MKSNSLAKKGPTITLKLKILRKAVAKVLNFSAHMFCQLLGLQLDCLLRAHLSTIDSSKMVIFHI